MSYILHDQDKPREAGDKYYGDTVSENTPILMETTGYCQGTIGSHGDRMREGYAAAAPDMYGDVVMVYEAIPQKDGTYTIGEYLDTFEIKDTGYGYPTYQGKSEVRPDKNRTGKGSGTIESGIHLDIYGDMARCKEWMKITGGKVFGIVIKGKG